jgi:outer membrane protein OmpA-like peptidoglycan-associated protein
VDPGGEVAKPDELDSFVQNLIRQGNHGKAIQGLPNGQTSLDDMIGLPANVLVNRTTLLPSDLLFDYNQAQLRDSAKVGLQKIALIMDRNPELFCWIDGHSDLFGGDSFNDELSQRRADAVKQYLVASMGMDGDKIITRGLGKRAAIVTEGDVQQQSVNRRVEIKMRKTPPRATDFPAPAIAPVPRAAPVDSQPAKAMVEHSDTTAMPQSVPPSAIPIAPPAASPAPKAMLLKPTLPPAAIPVETAPPTPRAQVIPDPSAPPPPAAKVVAPRLIEPE